MVARLRTISTAALVAALLLTGLAAARPAHASVAAARTTRSAVRAASAATPGTFVPLPPARLMDTRTGLGGGAVGPKHTARLLVAGRGGVPATGVSSVVLTITAVAPLASGYALAWTDGQPMPTASNVLWTAGQNTAGVSVAGLGSTGYVDLYNGSWRSTHFVVDVSGYYVAGTPTVAGAFRPITPARLMDTRARLGGLPVQSRAAEGLQVAGRGGVPASGAAAVVLSVTAASPELAGYATVWPAGTARPTASNLNFVAHRSISNLVVARIGTGGVVDIYNGSAWATDFVVDVMGYYLAGTPSAPGTLSAVAPARLLDTRTRLGGTAPASQGTLRLKVAGRGGVPATGASAVVLNLTVVSAGAPGYATVWPDGTARPNASNINFLTGMTRANTVVVKVGAGGYVDLYNGSGRPLQLVVDVGAFVHAQPPMAWGQPTSVDPAQGGLGGLSCASATSCLAYDNLGAVSHTLAYAGGTWATPQRLPWSTGVLALECPTTTRCFAADSAGQVRTYDGTTWSAPVTVDAGGQVTGLSCPTTTFCVAVDSTGQAFVYSSGTWAGGESVDFSRLNAVSCVSATFCMAVANSNAYVYDGGSWTAAAQPSVSQPDAVSCLSTTFCALADVSGSLDVWRGTTWDAPAYQLLDNGANSVSCVTTSFCVASGNFATYATFDGSAWSSQLQEPTTLGDVTCRTTTFCLAVGGSDADLVSRFNGTAWSTPAQIDPLQGHPVAVSCATDAACQLVDEFGRAAGYDGTGWTAPAPAESDFAYPPSAVSCATPTFCRATTLYPIDGNGHLLLYDGTAWSQNDDLSGLYASISCPTTTFCAALQYYGRVGVFTGSTWDISQVAQIGHSSSVSCVSATFCVAVGYSNLAATYDGAHWTAFTLPEAANAGASAVSCATTSSCTIVNASGATLRYDGITWTAPVSVDASGGGLTSVSCPTTSFCAAVDTTGRALTWDGVAWSAPTSIAPNADGLVSVSCPTDSYCVAAAKNGDVVTGSR